MLSKGLFVFDACPWVSVNKLYSFRVSLKLNKNMYVTKKIMFKNYSFNKSYVMILLVRLKCLNIS